MDGTHKVLDLLDIIYGEFRLQIGSDGCVVPEVSKERFDWIQIGFNMTLLSRKTIGS